MDNRRQWVIVAIASVAVLIAAIIGFTVVRSGRPDILAVLPTADNPFWVEMRLGAEEAASQLGNKATVTVRTGTGDADARTQIQILNDFLRGGHVAALVLGPASSTEVVAAVAEFNHRGTPVVVVDSRLDPHEIAARGASVDAFLGSNNAQGGTLAAQEIARLLGPGSHSVLMIEGSAGQETAIARSRGFRESAPSDWKITREDGRWEQARAREIMEAALNAGPPDAVFASSDEMALGAVTALERSGVAVAKWPVIVGFDATADGVAAVKEHKLAATIRQEPKKIGAEAVRIAYALAKGDRSQAGDHLLDVKLVLP